VEETLVARIPTTDSIQELTAFWQDHDVTDFEEELVEVAEPVFRRTHVVGVRFGRGPSPPPNCSASLLMLAVLRRLAALLTLGTARRFLTRLLLLR
jgi:hypothetical protein